jgi:hypothetical protein
MLQHVANFHDDVKLVIVYSLITRLMLRNVQRSVIGKKNFPTLMNKAYSTYAVLEDREKFFLATIPEIHAFVKENLYVPDELEQELIDSLAEIAYYIIAHSSDRNMHETISICTNPSYRKGMLKSAWNAATQGSDFETWYNSLT